MAPLKIALIISSDMSVRSRIALLLQKIGVSYIFESRKTGSILRLLEIPVGLVIVDTGSFPKDGTQMIRLIKNLRPRIPLLAIVPDDSAAVYNKVLDAGAMYCIVSYPREKELVELINHFWGQTD